MTEKWRDIPGWEQLYEISNEGRVRSVRSGKVLSPGKGHKGRLHVSLSYGNLRQNVKVHRAVLLAFLGSPPPGFIACHNDGNASNNHLSNLRWDSPRSNQLDRVRHGTEPNGEKNPSSKLTDDQVRIIRSSGRTTSDLAKEFGVSPSCVKYARSKKTWGHV